MKQYQTEIGSCIDQAVHHLEKDELVAIPTETVYGLAANAFSEAAIGKVFKAKQRPASNPLIVHVENINDIRHLVREMPQTAAALLQHFAPGPLTIILKKNCILPATVSGGRPEVAFRIPAHPVTLSLLQKAGFPLVAPSANTYTTISPTHPGHVMKTLYGRIPYILDGGVCEVGIESTVVGFDPDEMPVIYRQGAITPEEIESVAGRVRINGDLAATLSPGLSRHHYSPRTPMVLVDRFRPHPLYDNKRIGILSFRHYYREISYAHQFVLSVKGDLREAAKNIYRGLHQLDDLHLDLIVAERLPGIGLGLAINDRLARAAQQPEDGGLLVAQV